MFLLHSKKYPTYPSFFPKSLKDAFIKVGCSSFDLHAQQDVAEVLEILLEELTPLLLIVQLITSKASLVSSVTLDIHLTEQKTSYLYFAFLSSKIFQPRLPSFRNRSLIGSNTPYCNIGSGIRESDCKLSLLSVGNCLIMQLNCFFVSNVLLLRALHRFLFHIQLRWLLK